MSNLSQFGGSQPTRAIVNAWSSGGLVSNASASTINGAREVLSGALTANTLATVVTINQGGQIPWLSAYAKDTTSRTVRLVVICDGVTVFDATSGTLASANTGIIAAGILPSGTAPGNPIRFNSSCVIRVASSLTETNLVAVGYSLN